MPHLSPEQRAEITARVQAWIPADFTWRVASKREHDRWFALAVDFDITGTGETREQALEEMFELLGAYLGHHLHDGVAFDGTLRPVPRSLQVRIHVGTVLYRRLAKLSRHPERLSLPRERAYPFSALPVEATALC